MPAETTIPRDVFRAVCCLFGLAALAVVVAGMYRIPYTFETRSETGCPT